LDQTLFFYRPTVKNAAEKFQEANFLGVNKSKMLKNKLLVYYFISIFVD